MYMYLVMPDIIVQDGLRAGKGELFTNLFKSTRLADISCRYSIIYSHSGTISKPRNERRAFYTYPSNVLSL